MTETLELLKARAAYEKYKAMSVPLWADEDPEEEEPPRDISAAGKRMARKRRRERNARLFWRFRLKTGSANTALIAEAVEYAPAVVESARVEVIEELREFAAAYPERAEPVTFLGKRKPLRKGG